MLECSESTPHACRQKDEMHILNRLRPWDCFSASVQFTDRHLVVSVKTPVQMTPDTLKPSSEALRRFSFLFRVFWAGVLNVILGSACITPSSRVQRGEKKFW